MAKPNVRYDVLPLRELLCHHAPNTVPGKLADLLAYAIEKGDFDGTDADPGLFELEPGSGHCRAIRWKEYVKSNATPMRQGRKWPSVRTLVEIGYDEHAAIAMLVEDGSLAVSHEAYLRFCDAHDVKLSKICAAPDEVKRHSGGAPPKVRRPFLEWFWKQPPGIKKLNDTKLAREFILACNGVGDEQSVRITIGRLRKDGSLKQAETLL